MELKAFWGGDAFRAYKAKNTKLVLCVCKPIIERFDEKGRRMQGWTLNNRENCVKMALYEGGTVTTSSPPREAWCNLDSQI